MLSGIFSFSDKPVLDAKRLYENFRSRGWDTSAFDRRANSYRVFGGGKPSEGWILMRREHVKDLFEGPESNRKLLHTLKVGYRGESDEGLRDISYVVADRAIALGKYPIRDPDAAYLVRLTDWKAIAKMVFLNTRFNPRIANSPGGLPDFTNTSPIQDRRDALDAIADVFTEAAAAIVDVSYRVDRESKSLFSEIGSAIRGATFPDDVSEDVPENLRYQGVSAWDAACDLLFRAGYMFCEPTRDPSLVLGICRTSNVAAESNVGISAQTIMTERKKDRILDADPLSGNVFLPKKVKVCFRRMWDGIDDTRSHADPFYVKEYTVEQYLGERISDTPSAVFSTIPQSCVVVHDDDLFALMPAGEQTPLTVPDNDAALAARAQVVGLATFQQADWRAAKRVAWWGALRLWPCELFSETCWSQTCFSGGIETEISFSPIVVPKVATEFRPHYLSGQAFAVKLKEAIAKNASGQAAILRGPLKAGLTETSIEITVFNPYVDLPIDTRATAHWVETSAVDEDDAFVSSGFELIAADCP